MAFGKPGRPAEDRLARQSEIYEAVSPLILDLGVHRMSMGAAARAAYLSVGGLYHHFPTKRDLVLHGLQPEAIARRCQAFHDRFDHLARSNPLAYLEAGLDSVTGSILFVRPAFHAALELGVETFKNVLETSLTTATDEFAVSLQNVFLDAAEDEVYQAGRAMYRAMISALLDKNITAQEFRGELSALINGYFDMRQATTPVATTSFSGNELEPTEAATASLA
jgi:AcrR family transcriptional regulator